MRWPGITGSGWGVRDQPGGPIGPQTLRQGCVSVSEADTQRNRTGLGTAFWVCPNLWTSWTEPSKSHTQPLGLVLRCRPIKSKPAGSRHTPIQDSAQDLLIVLRETSVNFWARWGVWVFGLTGGREVGRSSARTLPSPPHPRTARSGKAPAGTTPAVS